MEQKEITPELFVVGAGPGDPELITVKAYKILQTAGAVLYDNLANKQLLDLTPEDCDHVYVGKQPYGTYTPQEDINAMIKHFAFSRGRVVRLKGGDPFIFGRGGEEMEAAQAAGVAVEVVPGISAANGAAAAAQIALTHRDAASVVSFVAGQCKGLAEQDWAGLAGKGRTLVIYMGVKTAPAIAEKLMGDGLAPDMPLAVIENAARTNMRVLRGPLAALPQLVERERVKSPALIIIGDVTARDDSISGLALAKLAVEASL